MPEQSLFLRRSELWSEAVKAPELMGHSIPIACKN